MSLTFRWLGVAGVELKAGGQRLAIDPFFTRPSALGFIKPVQSNTTLVARKLPDCDAVLITHAHWDHVMDVPAVLRQTGAAAYGSDNTCQLLRLLGAPADQVHHVEVGDRVSLGAFKVEVIRGQHSRVPFGRLFNSPLSPNLEPPLRLQDYRMDVCLGYRITVMGKKVLICAAEPHPAEVLFAVAQETKAYYRSILHGTEPRIFIPIHWDHFMRPLEKPVKRFTRPGRMGLWQITRLARLTLRSVKVIIPAMFREYTLGEESD